VRRRFKGTIPQPSIGYGESTQNYQSVYPDLIIIW
jgi:ribosomal protein L32E